MKCGQLVIVTVVKGQCGLLFLLRPLALQCLGFRFVYTARSGWLAHQNWFRAGSWVIAFGCQSRLWPEKGVGRRAATQAFSSCGGDPRCAKGLRKTGDSGPGQGKPFREANTEQV